LPTTGNRHSRKSRHSPAAHIGLKEMCHG
jgi:hypothetical protein